MTNSSLRRFAVVNSTDGSFHVHKHDCADLARRENARANGIEFAEAVDADACVDQIVESLRGDFGDEADQFFFNVYPCAR